MLEDRPIHAESEADKRIGTGNDTPQDIGDSQDPPNQVEELGNGDREQPSGGAPAKLTEKVQDNQGQGSTPPNGTKTPRATNPEEVSSGRGEKRQPITHDGEALKSQLFPVASVASEEKSDDRQQELEFLTQTTETILETYRSKGLDIKVADTHLNQARFAMVFGDHEKVKAELRAAKRSAAQADLEEKRRVVKSDLKALSEELRALKQIKGLIGLKALFGLRKKIIIQLRKGNLQTATRLLEKLGRDLNNLQERHAKVLRRLEKRAEKTKEASEKELSTTRATLESIKSTIRETEREIAALEILGEGVNSFKQAIAEVQKIVEKKEYIKARVLAQKAYAQANDELKRVSQLRFVKEQRRLQEMIDAAFDYGANTRHVQQVLDWAEHDYRAARFAAAIITIDTIPESIQEAKDQYRLLKTVTILSSVEKYFEECTSYGLEIELDQVMNKLAEARAAFRKKDFVRARNLAVSGKKILRRKYEQAAIKTIQGKLTTAHQRLRTLSYIHSPIHDIEALLHRAEEHFSKGEYTPALNALKTFDRQLSKHTKTEQRLDVTNQCRTVEKLAETLRDLGYEDERLNNLLSTIKRSIEEQEFTRAEEELTVASNRAKALLRKLPAGTDKQDNEELEGGGVDKGERKGAVDQ